MTEELLTPIVVIRNDAFKAGVRFAEREAQLVKAQKGGSNPKLREKIAKVLERIDEPHGEDWDKIEYTPYKDMYLRRADRIIALMEGI